MKKIKSLSKAQLHERALEIAMELVGARAEIERLRERVRVLEATGAEGKKEP